MVIQNSHISQYQIIPKNKNKVQILKTRGKWIIKSKKASLNICNHFFFSHCFLLVLFFLKIFKALDFIFCSHTNLNMGFMPHDIPSCLVIFDFPTKDWWNIISMFVGPFMQNHLIFYSKQTKHLATLKSFKLPPFSLT